MSYLSWATGTAQNMLIQDINIRRIYLGIRTIILACRDSLTACHSRKKCEVKTKKQSGISTPLLKSLYQMIRFVVFLGFLRSRYNVHLCLKHTTYSTYRGICALISRKRLIMLLLLHCLSDYAKDTLYYLQWKKQTNIVSFLVYVSLHVCTCECVYACVVNSEL